MVAINEEVAYRSMGGDLWPAKVIRVREGGFVDIELFGPYLREAYPLTAVRWSDDVADPRSGARPKKLS